VAEGSTLMVTATRPDGSIEPLLWLYNYKPQFARPYWYSAALRLPASFDSAASMAASTSRSVPLGTAPRRRSNVTCCLHADPLLPIVYPSSPSTPPSHQQGRRHRFLRLQWL